MKYMEFGIGNRWFIRTEIEQNDGKECEQKGIVFPIVFVSVYVRVWIGKTVIIFDSKEGFKYQRKNRNSLKLILGIVSKISS